MRIRHKAPQGLVRVLVLIAFAAFWTGARRPPGLPGCRGPRPPMPLNDAPPAALLR